MVVDDFGFNDIEMIETVSRWSRKKDFATGLTGVDDAMRVTLVTRFVVGTDIDSSALKLVRWSDDGNEYDENDEQHDEMIRF